MKRSLLDHCLGIALRYNNPDRHPQWDQYKHFSFIVQNNQLVEWAMNCTITRGDSPCRFMGYPEYGKLHAEYNACKKARGLLTRRKSFDVVNIRLTKKGELRVSKPCPSCMEYLQTLGVHRIYYTTESGFECLNAKLLRE